MERRASQQRHDGKFAERVRRLRMQQGLSQVEVGQLAGVPFRTYNDWERGLSVPYPGKALRAIAHVYRVAPGYLLLGDEEGMNADR